MPDYISNVAYKPWCGDLDTEYRLVQKREKQEKEKQRSKKRNTHTHFFFNIILYIKGYFINSSSLIITFLTTVR